MLVSVHLICVGGIKVGLRTCWKGKDGEFGLRRVVSAESLGSQSNVLGDGCPLLTLYTACTNARHADQLVFAPRLRVNSYAVPIKQLLLLILNIYCFFCIRNWNICSYYENNYFVTRNGFLKYISPCIRKLFFVIHWNFCLFWCTFFCGFSVMEGTSG